MDGESDTISGGYEANHSLATYSLSSSQPTRRDKKLGRVKHADKSRISCQNNFLL
jgi:hypothetical protein